MSPDVGRVFREEHGRAIAILVRALGDIDLAEDAVQEAFVEALQRWPESGVPPPHQRDGSSRRLATGRSTATAEKPPVRVSMPKPHCCTTGTNRPRTARYATTASA